MSASCVIGTIQNLNHMIELFGAAGGKQLVLSFTVWLHAGVFLPAIITEPR